MPGFAQSPSTRRAKNFSTIPRCDATAALTTSGAGFVMLCEPSDESWLSDSCFFVEIACAHHRTDHVDDQATRGDAGDLVDVDAGGDLHDIHADDAALLHQSKDQLARLGEGDAAGARARHARRDRRIHPVE